MNQIVATYIDHMGSDLSVVNAARVSFGKESEWDVEEEWVLDPDPEARSYTPKYTQSLKNKDQKLIRYLAKHGHISPFGHCFMSFHVKAPVFVARQLVKHKFLRWNEISRRYVDDPPEFYRPDSWRMRAENVKQGSSEIRFIPKGSLGKCPYCEDEFLSAGNKQRFCSQKCQGAHYRKTPEGWEKTKLSRLKSSAKRRGIPFSINSLPMPTKCPYLGIELDYTNDSISDNSPSVDRVDNNKGYEEGNVEVISNKANIMKGTASSEELITFAKASLAMHGGYITPQTDSIDEYYQEMTNLYNRFISQGMAPEEARGFMPATLQTEWYWSGSLDAFAAMCNLRLKEDAQYESRLVAQQIDEKASQLFPHSWKALVHGED